jgi:hypothetical protein
MEERFASVHAHMVLVTNDPSLNNFFAQLAAQDRAHIELLESEQTR